MHDSLAGYLSETERGYQFAYSNDYLLMEHAAAVSLTLPLRAAPYLSRGMFSFFDGLIPEGWLLDVAGENWKLDKRDRMACCWPAAGIA